MKEISSRESEDLLLRRAVRGDEAAFTSLYDANVDAIYRFVLLRVSDPATAEDLASQVFMKAWENLGRYKPGGAPFRAWLFTIARNTVVDHYRTSKATLPLEAASVHNAQVDEIPHLALEKQQEAESVVQALRQITEDQRTVISLRFIEGLSTREIARAMGKREGAVRALQMRALQALNEYLEDQ